jgi:hypothetical protein
MARGQGEDSIRQRPRRDGTVYWEARVTLAGRQVSYYGDTKTQALKHARAARVDAERGLGREVTTVTVERHMQDWLEMVRPTIRNSTHLFCLGYMRTWILPYLGRLKLTDLTPAHVRGMLTAVAAAGRADATVARVRGTLSSALRQTPPSFATSWATRA